MIIRLSDISIEGKEFYFSNETAELNYTLNELLKNTPYVAELKIKALNSKDYELRGTLKTAVPEQCSRCGIDFKFKIDEKFHELMIPKQFQNRTDKYSKSHTIITADDENAMSVFEYEDDKFDIGEYLHEVIALASPFNPAPEEDKDGNCSLCLIPIKGKSFSYDEKMPEDDKKSPFDVLKKLKLN